MRHLVFALLLLSCSTAAASYAAPDYVFNNLVKFYNAREFEIETNKVVASWSDTPALIRQSKWKSWNTTEWEKLRAVKDRMFLVRVLVVPLVLLFVLAQTRSFFEAPRHSGWQLLIPLVVLWGFFLRPLVENYQAGSIRLVAALLAGFVIVLSRDRLRFGSPRMGLGILLLAICCWAPFERRLVPQSYAYLDDYEFPSYRVSSPSTNTVVVHEKLDLRTGDRKAVLFKDGRRERIPRADLDQWLSSQQLEVNTAALSPPAPGGRP